MTAKGGSIRPVRKRTAHTSDYKVNCDRCGFIFYSSDCSIEWTGLFVCRWCWEKRNDQDFIRGVRERIAVPIARPEYGLPTIVCTTRCAVAGIMTAGCAIAGRDDLFSFGYNPSPLNEETT